jgi:Tfp pilus assembly protein PilN
VTVLTSESSALLTGVRLPRVNLLPPEIAEAKKLRKVQMGLGAAGFGAVALVGLLYMGASHSVSSAQQALDTAQSRQTSLNGQIGKYGDVTGTIAKAQAAQVQLTNAMGDEVRFSKLLTDLSLSVPSTVWLKGLSFAGPAPTGAAPTSPSSNAIGTLTVSGAGFTHDDVALWLEAVAGIGGTGKNTYANPYFTNSTEVLVGPRVTVNFSSTADVTPNALSRRYLTPGS